MLFDQFDKKIKEAAEQHHPAYDEKAWKKMENLLNLHLPREKKDRRRIFLLLLTFLLLGGGVFVIVSRTGNGNNVQVAQDKTLINETGSKQKSATVPQLGTEKTSNEVTSNKIQQEEKGNANTNLKTSADQQLFAHDQHLIQKRSDAIKKQKPAGNDLSQDELINKQNNETVLSGANDKTNTQLNANTSIPTIAEIARNENKVAQPVDKKTDVKKENDQLQVSSQTKSSQKNKQPKQNGLSFFVSAGPDVSKAGSSKAGKVTLTYGAGVAYTINRFTIKAGVFESKKIYWASPNEYELSWTPPNVKFEGADANCRVVVIPLKAAYNFAFSKNSNWFAGAGLSSYLMKDEKYVLEYKTSTGAPYYHPYEAKNENKHYFSIVNVSAGYTRQLNKTLSISAEPYLEIPMSGVGAGKIHLNSAGLLFTLGVSPFRK